MVGMRPLPRGEEAAYQTEKIFEKRKAATTSIKSVERKAFVYFPL